MSKLIDLTGQNFGYWQVLERAENGKDGHARWKCLCTACGKHMQDGYCINDGDEYFCSDDCLHAYYSEEEYEQLCEQDAGYWTTWYQEVT